MVRLQFWREMFSTEAQIGPKWQNGTVWVCIGWMLFFFKCPSFLSLSFGNTFFSLTKVKVKVDIKFNVYLKSKISK